MRFRYTVKASFDDEALAGEWLGWLRNGHCRDVLDGGASHVEIVAMEGEGLSFEVRYDFEDREAFERYEAEHAEALRAEGLQRFPSERGVRYARTTGHLLYVDA